MPWKRSTGYCLSTEKKNRRKTWWSVLSVKNLFLTPKANKKSPAKAVSSKCAQLAKKQFTQLTSFACSKLWRKSLKLLTKLKESQRKTKQRLALTASRHSSRTRTANGIGVMSAKITWTTAVELNAVPQLITDLTTTGPVVSTITARNTAKE